MDDKVTKCIFENKNSVSSECMENISSVSHRSQEKNPKIIWQKQRKKSIYFNPCNESQEITNTDQNLATSQIWFTLTSANKRRGKTARIVKQNTQTSQKHFLLVFIVITHFKSVYYRTTMSR